MNFLPDVNVWLALLSARHVHNEDAVEWISEVADGSVALCRITQMGLLRLLTNERVMGPDVVSAEKAWRLHDQLLKDPRFFFMSEPEDLAGKWREISSRKSGPSWTDGYLVAFATVGELRLVTFDKALNASSTNALIL